MYVYEWKESDKKLLHCFSVSDSVRGTFVWSYEIGIIVRENV